MALTFPRPLPECGLRSGTLTLAENVAMSPSGKGAFANLTQVNDPVWLFAGETYTLRPALRAEWGAWKISLQGGLRSFLAFDTRRRAPLAYAGARSPDDIKAGWAGTANVVTLGAGGVLTLSGLPAQYRFTPGDRIGIEQGAPLRRGYYEVIEPAGADGAGSATVTVAPFLHTALFSPGAVARLWRPVCELVLDWPSGGDENGALPSLGTFTFSAWQRI